MKTIMARLAALTLLCGTVNAGIAGVTNGSPRTMLDLRGETVLVPSSTPETKDFRLLTFFKISFDERLVAIVAFYNDPTTPRDVDYAEIYQGTGRLLGIAWLDQVGIPRLAMDYGLNDEEPKGGSGELVLVFEGEPV